jgi:hypothetical protein
MICQQAVSFPLAHYSYVSLYGMFRGMQKLLLVTAVALGGYSH